MTKWANGMSSMPNLIGRIAQNSQYLLISHACFRKQGFNMPNDKHMFKIHDILMENITYFFLMKYYSRTTRI